MRFIACILALLLAGPVLADEIEVKLEEKPAEKCKSAFDILQRWQDNLDLHYWKIKTVCAEMETEEETILGAVIEYDTGEQRALVAISPKQNDFQQRATMIHELLHIAMSDVSAGERTEERLVRQLEMLLIIVDEYINKYEEFVREQPSGESVDK